MRVKKRLLKRPVLSLLPMSWPCQWAWDCCKHLHTAASHAPSLNLTFESPEVTSGSTFFVLTLHNQIGAKSVYLQSVCFLPHLVQAEMSSEKSAVAPLYHSHLTECSLCHKYYVFLVPFCSLHMVTVLSVPVIEHKRWIQTKCTHATTVRQTKWTWPHKDKGLGTNTVTQPILDTNYKHSNSNMNQNLDKMIIMIYNDYCN